MKTQRRETHIKPRLHTNLLLELRLLLQLLQLILVLLFAHWELADIIRRQLAILAVNVELLRNLTNSVSGPGMASSRLLRALLAVLLGNLDKAIVQIVGQVTRGATGLTGQYVAGLDKSDLLAALDELVGGGNTGDTGADDGDVGFEVFVEGRELGDLRPGKLVCPDGVG